MGDEAPESMIHFMRRPDRSVRTLATKRWRDLELEDGSPMMATLAVRSPSFFSFSELLEVDGFWSLFSADLSRQHSSFTWPFFLQ
jgi:hypothetical protein